MDKMDEDEHLPIAELTAKLAVNLYDYDAHLQLISAYRDQAEFQLLQEARKSMQSIFALSPELWLQWISDCEQSNVDSKEISQLYEQSLVDYASVDVWKSYIEYARENLSESEQLSLISRAIDCFRHDIVNCHVFYHYRINTLLSDSSSGNNEIAQNEIRALFMQLLTFPHAQHTTSFELYQTWKKSTCSTAEEYDKSIWWMKQSGNYDKTVSDLVKLEIYEHALESKQHAWTEYHNYINNVTKLMGKNKQVPFTVCLYERCISTGGNMLVEEVWKSYIDFLRTHGLNDKIPSVAARAVKNVTWSVELWVLHLRNVELLDSGTILSQLDNCVKALDAYLKSDMESCVRIFILKTEIQYRHLINNEAKLTARKKADRVKEIFNNVLDLFKQYHQENIDPYARIERRFAKVLAISESKNITESISIFQGIFESNTRKKFSELWIDFIKFYQCKNAEDIDGCREIFKQALNDKNIYSLDWPETLIEYWKEFEGCHGTIQNINDMMEQLDVLLLKLFARRQKEALKSQTPGITSSSINQTKHEKKDKKLSSSNFEEKKYIPKSKSESKRPPETDEEDSSTANETDGETTKRSRTIGPQRLQDEDPEKSKLTVFVSNLPKQIDEGKLQYIFKECGPTADIRMVKDEKRMKTYAYIEFPTAEAAQKALSMDKTPLEGTKRQMFVSEFKPKKKPIAETNSIYVSNLPQDITDEMLKEVFGEVGPVSSIRLVKKKNQNPIAFVQFDSDDCADLALSLNGLELGMINPKPIQIEKSKKPKLKTEEHHQKQPAKNMFMPTQMILGAKKGPSKIGASLKFTHQKQSESDKTKSDRTVDSMETDTSPTKPKSNDDFRAFLRKN